MQHRVFLDANVLYSAVVSPVGNRRRIWWASLEIELCTCQYAVGEAERNLLRPDQFDGTRPIEAQQSARLATLLGLLRRVRIFEDSFGRPLPDGISLRPKDHPILLTAIDVAATHLVTGDTRDFGLYFGKTIAGVLILPPAAYLALHPPTT